jgi:perosamine synthetase
MVLSGSPRLVAAISPTQISEVRAVIPISTVRLGADVEARVLEVIRSGTIAQGPVVAEFEQRFAELTGARHAIAVNNGTTALVAAIQSLDLVPGDEVITSPFTFIATLNAILEAGGTARFGDIREDDFCLDPASVEALINDRTKAIIPVHLYGQGADMVALTEIAERHGIAIIEDAAQAHGAAVGDKKVGTFGIGCFSFYATKNLTTGEGGMITTDDDAIAERLRIMRNQGMRQRYEYVMAGHNYRLTDLQAAVVLPQLDGYADQVAARNANARALTGLISDIPGVIPPRALPGRSHVWHQYTILLPDSADRDDVVRGLADRGVASGIYYPRLVTDYDVYRGRSDVHEGAAPTARSVAQRCLSLPVHASLEDGDVQTIAEALGQVLSS